MKVEKPVALETGASSGIGKATAERLVTAGYRAHGTSRRGATPCPRLYEVLSVVEPANPQTQFEVNLLEAGADLDEGGRARGLGLLRRFAPVGAVDAAIRKNLRLDAAPASLHRTSVPE